MAAQKTFACTVKLILKYHAQLNKLNLNATVSEERTSPNIQILTKC